MIKRIGKLNYPLIIGGIIVTLVLIISIFSNQIVPLDPYALNQYELIYKNGEMTAIVPQAPPNSVNILGTDLLGRDLLSQLIAGIRPTLILISLIAIFRFSIALPLALFAGFGNRICERIITFFNRTFSTIPEILISIMILNIKWLKDLPFGKSIVAFVIVLTFVGWGRLGYFLLDKVKDILNQEFIQGEIVVGKSKFLIAVQNVLPHLTAMIIVSFFLEISRVLVIIAGLGVFELYVGKSKFTHKMIFSLPPEGFGLSFMPNYYPEWGGILASTRYAIRANKLWIAMYPVVAFFITVLGFNLLGEGFNIEVNKRNSRVITTIRRIPYYLSPRTYIYEIKHFKNNKKAIAIKTSVVIAIVTTIILSSLVPKSLYEIDAAEVIKHVNEFNKDDYEGRMIGTLGHEKAADYIVNQLKASGVEPYFEGNYIDEIESRYSIAKIKSSRLSIQDNQGNEVLDLNYMNDFYLRGIYSQKVMCYSDKMKGEIITLEDFDNKRYSRDKQYFLVLDEKDVPRGSDEFIYFFRQLSYERYLITGVIVPEDISEYYEEKMSLIQAVEREWCEANSRYMIVPIMVQTSKDVCEVIKEHRGKELTLENDVSLIENFTVKNIGGIIKGKSSNSKDTIIVTANYDYLGKDGDILYKGLADNGTSVASVLEIAKGLNSLNAVPENDIVFLLFDASKHFEYTGARMYKGKGLGTFEDTYTFSLSNLGIDGSNSLYLDTTYALSNQREYYDYIKYLKERGKEIGITVKQESLFYSGREDLMYIKDGKGKGVHIKSVNSPEIESRKYYGAVQDDISVIDSEKLKKQAQLILDTIVHMAYDEE